MTLWAPNRGDKACRHSYNETTGAQVTLFATPHPNANQRVIITGWTFYRRFGGVAPVYYVLIQNNDTLVELAEYVLIPAVAGGDLGSERTDMLFVGGLGEQLRVIFNAVDAGIDIKVSLDSILV